MDGTRKLLVFGVLAIWSASCIGALVNQELVALAGITTPVISAIIAGVFADSYLKQKRNGNGGEKHGLIERETQNEY